MLHGAHACLHAQLSSTLCDTRLLCPWDYPGKDMEWVAISFSRGSSQPETRTHIPGVSYVGRWILYPAPPDPGAHVSLKSI